MIWWMDVWINGMIGWLVGWWQKDTSLTMYVYAALNFPSKLYMMNMKRIIHESSCSQRNAFALSSLCAGSTAKSCTAVCCCQLLQHFCGFNGPLCHILPHLKYVVWVRIWRTPRTPSSFLSSLKHGVDLALPAPLESLLLGGQVLGWEGNHTCGVWSHDHTWPEHKDSVLHYCRCEKIVLGSVG